ncbi:MAG TPA: ABC-2 transporter permease [Tissierellia bacterium]|nr:ABC-2 transporter permease [Tissierellia bacterium]
MINLIKKDLRLSIKVNIFAVIYALFISATGLISNNPIIANLQYVLGIIILTFVAVIFTNGYDDKYRSEVVLISLPLDRKNIVRGKYISLLVFFFISSGAVIVFTNILSMFGIANGGNIAGVQSAILAANIILLFYSIYYPIYFKVGEGLRTFNVVLWMALIMGPAVIGRGFKALDQRGLLDKLMNIDLNTINLYLFGIVIVIYYISLQISKGIYMRREF